MPKATMNTPPPEFIKQATTIPATGLPSHVAASIPKPAPMFPLIILLIAAFICAFLLSFIMKNTMSCCRSMEIYTVQIEKMTPEEQAAFKNFKGSENDFYKKTEPHPKNYHPLPNMGYSQKIEKNRMTTYALRSYPRKILLSEKMGTILELPIFFMASLSTLAGITFYLYFIFQKYEETLRILASHKNFPFKNRFSSRLLAVPVVNLFWIFPTGIITSHLCKKMSQSYGIPCKGPSILYSLLFSLSLLLTPLLILFIPGQCYILNLFLTYYYLKKINDFVACVHFYSTTKQ